MLLAPKARYMIRYIDIAMTVTLTRESKEAISRSSLEMEVTIDMGTIGTVAGMRAPITSSLALTLITLMM